jgi:hypothetical protein
VSVMQMRSMAEILWLIADQKINTPEEADAVLTHEIREYARALQIDEPAARTILLIGIDRLAARASPAQAAKIRELFPPPPKETTA